MFGENSTTRLADITDGTSNTIAVAESTLNAMNGWGNPWGYRAWCHVGIDVQKNGINNWDWPGYIPSVPRRYGVVGGWGYAGSLHPSGANFLFADGSVHFLAQSTDATVKTATEISSSRFLPTLSASQPLIGRAIAEATI